MAEQPRDPRPVPRAPSCGGPARVTALHSPARAARLADLAARALVAEVDLAPKPGLVDPLTRGAHTDMDVSTFHRSVEAIRPWLPVMHETGHAAHDLGPTAFLARLREPGRMCEADMFAATGGVNTHKGAVFAFGLLLGCAGRLSAVGAPVDVPTLTHMTRRLARPLGAELTSVRPARTYGERAYRSHGLTGARGEAASGYRSVTAHALPAYRAALADGADESRALLQALLVLMARTDDTTLVKDGSLTGLRLVQGRARELLRAGGSTAPGADERLAALDRELSARRLSPGGCADLLAITWFLAHLEDEPATRQSSRP